MPSTPDAFWTHIPSWAWPIIVAGIIAFFLVQSIRAYDNVAKLFGTVGRFLHDRATEKAMRRVKHAGVDIQLLQREMLSVLDYVKRMEANLLRATDELECAIAYLVSDAQWHHSVDVLLAEHFPDGTVELPGRVPFSTFSHRWKEGWRPLSYQEED